MTFLNTSQMYRIFLLRWVGSKLILCSFINLLHASQHEILGTLFPCGAVITRRTWYPSVPPPGTSSELQEPPISRLSTEGHRYLTREIV